MACAHSISVSESGDKKGSDVDLEMFHATGWTINANPLNGHLWIGNNNELIFDVIRRIEFQPAMMQMCCVARNCLTRLVHVFIKGSPESIESLAIQESVPRDFRFVNSTHARTGLYTIVKIYQSYAIALTRQCFFLSFIQALAEGILGELSEDQIMGMKLSGCTNVFSEIYFN
jgi:hypothetical protein